jgi:hypothetical protein
VNVGSGVEVEVKGDELVIRVNLKGDYGKSQSGKTTIVASTRGGVPIEGTNGATVSLNVYRKV